MMNQYFANNQYASGAILSIQQVQPASAIWISSLSYTSAYVHEFRDIIVTGQFFAGQWPPIITCNFEGFSVHGYYRDTNHIGCIVHSWTTPDAKKTKLSITIVGFGQSQNYTSNALAFEFKKTLPSSSKVGIAFGVIGGVLVIVVISFVAYRYYVRMKKSDYSVIQ